MVVEGANRDCQILTDHSYKNVGALISNKKVIFITDANVHRHYADFFKSHPHIILPAGESQKSLATIESLYRKLLEEKVDRHSFIIGFGGGVVTDITGYLASTFYRGVPFGFIASSFLAQVDAAIGGKNGVNIDRYKNLIGTINQPSFVICDTELFQSLGQEIFKDGIMEALKHFAIRDGSRFDWLMQNKQAILDRDEDLLKELVKTAVKIKVDIVNQDEKESGMRKLLNFGHSYGHAIEKLSGLSHGKSIAIGMQMAGKLSQQLGHCSQETYQQLIEAIKAFEMPISSGIPLESLLDVIAKDKKKVATDIDYIFLNSIGQASIERIPLSTLRSLSNI